MIAARDGNKPIVIGRTVPMIGLTGLASMTILSSVGTSADTTAGAPTREPGEAPQGALSVLMPDHSKARSDEDGFRGGQA
jgi:hypothetical protein